MSDIELSFKGLYPCSVAPFVGIGAACILAAIVIWIFFHTMDDEEGDIVAIGTNRENREREEEDKEKQ